MAFFPPGGWISEVTWLFFRARPKAKTGDGSFQGPGDESTCPGILGACVQVAVRWSAGLSTQPDY